MEIKGEMLYWHSYNRETAIIITNNGKLYEDLNHQYCLDSFTKEYFHGLNFEDDLEDMIIITDKLFREGHFHGFDLFVKGNHKILASHYPRAYDVTAVKEAAMKYAKDNKCVLATFTSDYKLSDELRAIA